MLERAKDISNEAVEDCPDFREKDMPSKTVLEMYQDQMRVHLFVARQEVEMTASMLRCMTAVVVGTLGVFALLYLLILSSTSSSEDSLENVQHREKISHYVSTNKYFNKKCNFI